MPDSAELACYDCAVLLPLGWFGRSAAPALLFGDDGGAMAERPLAVAGLWKLLADHVGHRVRLLGEESDWGDAYGFPQLPGAVPIGDVSFEEFLGDWPARVAAPDTTAAGWAEAVLRCESDGAALSLGRFDPGAPPGERGLFGPGGRPGAESDALNRAVWKMLVLHVYHDVRLTDGRPPGCSRT